MFVLKHRPEDFRVRENLVVPCTDHTPAAHRYVLLRKRGYTTMEAVRLLADRIGVAGREVGYAGLKDEDGVTEQLLSVPARALAGELPAFPDGERWLRLAHYGYGHEPLAVGRLEGNAFRVVLRDLDDAAAGRLVERRRINLLFVNYYDTQRFGVPGGPKRTHLVGAALLDKEWARARHELAGLGAPESASAGDWTGPDEDFFRSLDPRTVAFYLAAHSSYRWNAEIRELIGAEHAEDATVDGLPYRFPADARAAAALQARCPELAYTRYTWADGPEEHRVMRPTVVQTLVTAGADGPDDAFPGRRAVELSFQLPSGSYATTALRQLMTQLTTRR
ncbi:tRNA pseudouridine(13) synthase TruD [Streptomyces sp. URMC 126]|uniref:tRNA pseudouridine(13) synthase TruD n=1 Tax=Streptomyces sp. URMC 126 TaxID=3423401 RepID=UPI003F1DA888